MKKRIFAALSALLLLLTACTAETSPSSAAPASASSTVSDTEETVNLGEFTADTLTGETLDQTIFADAKLNIINVWATYCGPCKVEMPYLGDIARERAGDVQIIGIVSDVIDQQGNPDAGQVALALEILEDANVEYPNLILNLSLAQIGLASFTAVPATIFVDSEGNLVGKGFYGSLSKEEWNKEIDARLEMIEE